MSLVKKEYSIRVEGEKETKMKKGKKTSIENPCKICVDTPAILHIGHRIEASILFVMLKWILYRVHKS